MTIDKFTVIRSKWGQGSLLTNDGKTDAPLAEKEAKLIILFAENGITLTFED